MSHSKAISAGKEHRQQYRGSKRFDNRCRNNGACGHCRGNRTHSTKVREQATRED